MRHRLFVLAYLATAIGSGFVHDPWVLAAAAGVVLVLAGREAGRIARRAVLAVGLFVATVTLAYAAFGWWREGAVDTAWILRTNLRAFGLTALTLLVVARVDARRAFAPWPGLLGLITVIGAQLRLLQRELEDYRLGLRSRTHRRANAATAARHAASGGAHLLGRALHDADEIALAMRARGAWHDRG
ncbi:MAG TPA: hypothetical protein VKA86_06755 [Candidatus Krumholzibacteria bacterium]|nr:hypothetical protein [Candidatus Krumholzibacteria bacterium]